jgi:CDP-glucose 4,6-dehydratase
VRGVVVASSEKAYGEQPNLPYREEYPLLGRHPYEVSKSCADLIAQSFAHTYGQAVAVTRCSNLYGGGDLNWNRLIPGTIRSLLGANSRSSAPTAPSGATTSTSPTPCAAT